MSGVEPRLSIRERLILVIGYEPTWFPEWGSGMGILLWSVGCYLTDDLTIVGRAWILPTIGLAFGPLRWVLLARLRYAPRVAAAALGGVFWGVVVVGAMLKFGAIPLGLAVVGLMCMDMLTVARFSGPCLRELLAEWKRGYA